MTSIEVRHVSLDAPDGRRLLDDVSLSVPSGSRLAICGPPNAGKTPLMRVVVGLDDHTDGDVLIDDTVVNAVSSRQRDLSMVFADYALHPHLDVYDNLAFAARLRRGRDDDAIDDRVEEVAAFLALDRVIEDKPSELDESKKQRVAIGRALVRDAKGYLFDEAFSAQNERVRAHVRSVTTEWQNDRLRTSIFTTSDPHEALTLADQVAVMHQGRVHQVGSPRELYDRPADLFVAAFVGAPPMNLIPARVSDTQLVLPRTTVLLDDALRQRVGGREQVIVGIRPEQCLDATTLEGRDVQDRVEFTTRIDDVEWQGKTQLVYLGYEVQPEVEEMLTDIEDALDFDLFGNFAVAELAAGSDLRAGMSARIVVPRSAVHVFDAQTGENLTQG